jgi:large-conductance mechanosensitive channel
VTPGVNDQYSAEIEAATDKYISEYQFLQNQAMQQQSTLDIVTSVKDKMFGVKDDMEHSVGIFAKQISDIRNQINVNKTTRKQATDYGKWMELALNFAIVLALLFLIFVIGRKAMSGASPPAPSGGALGAPARAPASDHTVKLLKALTRGA